MIVTFNFALWIQRYPEFASLSSSLAQLYFNEAGLYCDNTDASPCPADPTTSFPRVNYLWMLTAHIAALNAPVGSTPASPLVGRINSASEGSVSVQAQNDYAPGTVQWFQQTKYGSAFWAATRRFRSFVYQPGYPNPAPVPGNPFGI